MVTSTERKEKRNKGGALLSVMVGLVGMIDKAVSKSAQIEFPYPKRYSIIETDSVSELGYQIRIY